MQKEKKRITQEHPGDMSPFLGSCCIAEVRAKLFLAVTGDRSSRGLGLDLGKPCPKVGSSPGAGPQWGGGASSLSA